MIHIISIFLITSLISFCGSVQLGPVNLVIMKEVLEGRRRRTGLLIGAGVCIPEFIYSFFALFAAAWLVPRHNVLTILEWSIVPVMLALGLISIFKKKKKEILPDENVVAIVKQDPGTGRNLRKGIILSALNPQLLPFWLAILVMLNGYPFFNIETLAHRIAFVLGTGAGEFLLVMLVVWLTAKHREFLMKKMKKWNLNRVLGWLFIALALFQSMKLILQSYK